MNVNKPLVGLMTTIALGAGGVLATAAPANAATTLESRALAVARSKQGDPYRWGAAGPYAFDCSGLTYYSYKRAGKTLPRVAQSQYNHTRHIGWQYRRPGDLVFIGYSSRSVYHVGIYAGYWSGRSWMVNANSGHYRGYKVVTAPINEYLGGGRHAYYSHP